MARSVPSSSVARAAFLPDAAETFPSLLGRLRDLVAFEHHVVTGLPRPGQGIETGLVLASSWPQDLAQHYGKGRWYERDPVVAALRTAAGAFTEAALADARLEASVAHRHEIVLKRLGRHVLATPVHQFGRVVGAVVLHRSGPAFSGRNVELFELAAPALHAAATALPSARAAVPVTPRERECLAWSSVGYTARRIAVELAITENTVVAHLNAAMRKLGADTRTHAVALALRQGLLE